MIVLICTMHLTVCSCHVTYAFQREATLYSCLNVKELLARSRLKIWRWNDCNWTRTQNHLVLKRIAKWMSVPFRTKGFWVRVQLQSLHLQISRQLVARNSLTFSQLECGFTLNRVRDMKRTCSQMNHRDKYSEHSLILWSLWANGWVFV